MFNPLNGEFLSKEQEQQLSLKASVISVKDVQNMCKKMRKTRNQEDITAWFVDMNAIVSMDSVVAFEVAALTDPALLPVQKSAVDANNIFALVILAQHPEVLITSEVASAIYSLRTLISIRAVEMFQNVIAELWNSDLTNKLRLTVYLLQALHPQAYTEDGEDAFAMQPVGNLRGVDATEILDMLMPRLCEQYYTKFAARLVSWGSVHELHHPTVGGFSHWRSVWTTGFRTEVLNACGYNAATQLVIDDFESRNENNRAIIEQAVFAL